MKDGIDSGSAGEPCVCMMDAGMWKRKGEKPGWMFRRRAVKTGVENGQMEKMNGKKWMGRAGVDNTVGKALALLTGV